MKKEKTVKEAETKAKLAGKLKSMAVPVIITAVILVAIYAIVNFKGTTEQSEGMTIYSYDGAEEPVILENDKLKLTMDPLTTQFTLEVKETGKVWYSNPPEAESDPVAVASYKGRLQSTLLMTYSIATGLQTTYDSFTYGVSNGMYEIEQGDDYIKVNYSLGNVEKEYMIPPVCTVASMEQWFDKMETNDSSFIKRYYKKYDIKKLGKDDDKDALLASYPSLADEPLYVLRDTAKGAATQKLEQIFEKAGYTADDLAADKQLNAQLSSKDTFVFDVSIIYRLDGGDMVVEMPLSELEYSEATPIYTLVPLPYFGAGGPEDEGYLMVPEGGGALINFNNNKFSQASYYANLYGWDMALSRGSGSA